MRAPTLTQSIRQVLQRQACLALLLVALAFLMTALGSGTDALATLGWSRAKALAFGALIGILATLVTARSVIKSSHAVERADLGAQLGMLPIYSGLLLKLIVVAGGAFFGMVYLGLGPLHVVLGYITMQAGYVWAALNPHQ